MGVRGLTTFIAANADKYFKTYKLHDTYLVIDGNNLAAHLYKWHTKRNDCFGGDYDKYSKTVINFFKLLEECNITPLIIFDGGYEERKLRTIYSRIRNKVQQAYRLNCATEGTMTVFPLFLRELFVEIVMKLQLKIARCTLEADYEMACIARKLCCPVLSYDSDFYIFDVLYIPFSTFNMRSTKIKNNESGITYKVIECHIYRIENFLQSFGGLKSDCIPLLSVLLGNDYIRPRVFRKFYEHIKLHKRRYAESDQQRRIAAVIKWLQNETYESAVRKILGRLKMRNRKYVANQIKVITEGYLCSESKLLQFLGVTTNFEDLEPLNLCVKLDFDGILCNDAETEVNESSDSDDDSESDVSVESSGGNDAKKLPNVFEDNYKMCLYPACFIDMIYNKRYFFTPQIESYVTDTSHYISLDIIAAIHKILSFSNTYDLTCILRGKNKTLQNLQLELSTKELPEFNQLCNLTEEKGLETLFSVLNINMDIVNVVNEFPVSWRLYILSIIYWMQNVKSSITNSHIYAIILSAIALKLTDAYLQTNENKFLVKFHDEIQSVIQTKQTEVISNITNLQIALDSITKIDCIMFVREIISSFQMDQKLRKNPKLFNIDIVHSFAQLQSCAFHIKYLNTLLNNPFQDYLISEFYNGTLIYNLCANFLNRSDLEGYINLIFKYCPNILTCFKIIVCLLKPFFCNNLVKNVVLKRKKKKSNNEKIFVENVCIHSDDENSLYDVNNKFSLLRFVNE